ncbi:MAG TPA: hypothetical protein VK780_10595, partial [Thermoanaerobaculia bacterium]|nr:hypothetical protein [Thermoanaerobaculia bacterium]
MTSAPPARRLWLVGYLFAAALRVVFVFAYPGGYDTQSYEMVVSIEERHGNVYSETTRYNYSPVWGWVLLGLSAIGRATGLGLVRAVGLFLLAVDVATAMLVARLAGARFGPARGHLAGLLFFANPVSVLISSWHLQFDNLSLLCLLLAIFAFEREKGTAPVVGFLSASLLVKHVTWFHPLLFLGRKERRGRAWYLMPYAFFAVSFLPFAGSWKEILDHVFRYRGLMGNYGTEAALLIRGVPEWLPSALFAIACLLAVWKLDRSDLVRASLCLFLVILVFLPGFGRQYCVWPIALGSVAPGPGLAVYTVVAAGFLARGFFGFDQAPWWLPGWY